MADTTEKTKIELSNEDARLFVEFQKRYQFMKLLEKEGVFTVRQATLTIHITNIPGEVGSFDLERIKTHIKVV